MRKSLSILILIAMLVWLTVPAFAVNKVEIDTAVSTAAEYVLKTVHTPVVDPVGGEWAVIGLARSGYDVPDSYYAGYYRTVENYVREHGAILHDRKYTDNSRVILALTAAGYDPRNVAGYDLTLALGDFEKTIWQGVNGPIFALLALDSMNYPVPVNRDAVIQATRDMYVTEILNRQLDDGGWTLTGGTSTATKNQPSDPELTGIALQALAKYQHKPEVKTATDRALLRLTALQNNTGGFSGWGIDNVESTAQVLIALSELGIPYDDPRFVKNGNTTIDNILDYRNSDGSYRHTESSEVNNQMATEQALCGLAAAQRALRGYNTLYRMTDAAHRGESLPAEQETPVGAGLHGKSPDVNAVAVISAGKSFPDIQNHVNQTAIEALAERGIINGKAVVSFDGTPAIVFDPDATMTRAEFAAIVVRGLGLIENSQLTIDNFYFSDVIFGNWFCESVYIAAYYEIVKGTSATTFNPGGTITRQEASVMVARAARLCGMDTGRSDAGIRDTLAQFGDYRTVAAWAAEAMAFCYDAGILDDTAFDIDPLEAVRRCEMAEMLFRLLSSANLL